MKKEFESIKYVAEILFAILVQVMIVIVFGFTTIELPLVVYIVGWGMAIVIMTQAAEKLPE